MPPPPLKMAMRSAVQYQDEVLGMRHVMDHIS